MNAPNDPSFEELQAWCGVNWLGDLTDNQAMNAWRAAHPATALSAVALPPVLARERAADPGCTDSFRARLLELAEQADMAMEGEWFGTNHVETSGCEAEFIAWCKPLAIIRLLREYELFRAALAVSPAAPAQPEGGEAVDPVQWLRDNYDAYPNIASLCDAMTAALASNAAASAADAQEGAGKPTKFTGNPDCQQDVRDWLNANPDAEASDGGRLG